MANETYGAIKLSDANAVGSMLVKKMGGVGYAPKEWADVINLMGKLPEKTVSGGMANFSDGADDVPVRALTCTVNPNLSGVSSLNLMQTKKNLLDMTIYDGGTYNPSVGVTINLTTSSTQFIKVGNTYTIDTVQTWRAFSVRMPIKDGITYYRKFTISASGERVGSSEYYLDENNKVIGTVSNNTDNPHTKTGTITIPSGAVWFVITFTNRGTATNTLTITEPQIEVGSTATAYEAYTAPTVTNVPLGRTIYGGSANMVTGEGVDGYGYIVFDGSDDETWYDYANYEGYSINISTMKVGNRQDGVCNQLTRSTSSSQGQSNVFWLGVNTSRFYVIGVYQSMGSTLEAFKAYLAENPLILVYPLATETPFTFDPITPTPHTALGTNNLWNDCGDSEVTYRRDITLALQESGT